MCVFIGAYSVGSASHLSLITSVRYASLQLFSYDKYYNFSNFIYVCINDWSSTM